MVNGPVSEEKTAKTVVLLALGNFVSLPMYLIDAKFGLMMSISLNAIAMTMLHNIGKNRRPGSNALNWFNNAVSAQVGLPGNELDNTVRNIVNGGAAIFDEIVAPLYNNLTR